MPMSPEAISTCCSMSSLRPCAATTASSRVGDRGEREPAAAGPISGWVSINRKGNACGLSLREAFADVEQLAALIVFVPAAPGRAALGVPLLKALITSRELAIGTVLVMPPVASRYDPAAGL